jgi:hypothetical protein
VWEESTRPKTPVNKKDFWSFRPIKRTTPPQVKNTAWVKNPIDAFILAKLEAKAVPPATPADRRALLRRVTFDLIGLPPTPQEIDAFLKDTSPQAYAKVVDRLLASPHYGERWARHWLDVVRYADSLDARGVGGEGDITEAWRYRDWVVNALNADMPYNQFVLNQIAGDLLPTPTPGERNLDGMIATGMLAIGNWGNGDADKEKIITDIVDDQIDVISRGVMGVTLSCARCHDHKFDPFTTKDYYGLAGIFFSSHILPRLTPKGAGEVLMHTPLLTRAEEKERETARTRLTELEKQIQTERTAAYEAFAKSLVPETARYLNAVWRYRHRPTTEAGLTVDAFAKREGLHPFAVRQWLNLFGTGKSYTAMRSPIQNILGNAGVHGWKHTTDTPSMVINTTNEARQVLTFRLPPHSLSLHPAPTSGVALEWQSPIRGTIKIQGKLTDADGACGDGIAWQVIHQGEVGRQAVAQGGFENGGQEAIAPLTLQVQVGERVQLLVLPKQNHGCDTTLVEFEIESRESKQKWNPVADTLKQFEKSTPSNPLPDSYGNVGVWQFSDMAGGEGGISIPENILPALKTWQEIARGESKEAVERASQAFQERVQWLGKSSPFLLQRREEEGVLSPVTRDSLAKIDTEIAQCRSIISRPIPLALGALEGGIPDTQYAGFHDVRVHRRGNYATLGDLVPRRYPTILAYDATPPRIEGSGRRELAQWLVDPRHPLTARVIVNRLWQNHFGEGIVRTPNNFGLLGDRPSHPELLDWLASELVRGGWSLKRLHRLLILSNTYQQSSTISKKALASDVDNRLFSRFSRRRLQAEAIRDSLLVMSGKLDKRLGGVADRDLNNPRRTLYLMNIRSEKSGFAPLFDAADSTGIVEKRITSTVAPQALFLMNSRFVLDQVNALVERMGKENSTPSTRDRTLWLYRNLYGREATVREIQIAERYLGGTQNWKEYVHLLVCANEFFYVD